MTLCGMPQDPVSRTDGEEGSVLLFPRPVRSWPSSVALRGRVSFLDRSIFNWTIGRSDLFKDFLWLQGSGSEAPAHSWMAHACDLLSPRDSQIQERTLVGRCPHRCVGGHRLQGGCSCSLDCIISKIIQNNWQSKPLIFDFKVYTPFLCLFAFAVLLVVGD